MEKVWWSMQRRRSSKRGSSHRLGHSMKKAVGRSSLSNHHIQACLASFPEITKKLQTPCDAPHEPPQREKSIRRSTSSTKASKRRKLSVLFEVHLFLSHAIMINIGSPFKFNSMLACLRSFCGRACLSWLLQVTSNNFEKYHHQTRRRFGFLWSLGPLLIDCSEHICPFAIYFFLSFIIRKAHIAYITTQNEFQACPSSPFTIVDGLFIDRKKHNSAKKIYKKLRHWRVVGYAHKRTTAVTFN